MTMTDTPMLFSDLDFPRTRATDPPTSHAAADQSQAGITPLRLAVLRLIRNNPGVIGSELNDLYTIEVARDQAPRAAWDSPRKRAGELHEFGLVDVTGVRAGLTNKGERQFTINDRGLAALEG